MSIHWKVRFCFAILVPLMMFVSCGSITNVIREWTFSDQQEIDMGNKFKAEILADTKTYPVYKKDTSVIKYINAIGQKIATVQNDRDTLKFTFTVIDQDTTINAFAIPGGHVFIYTGLIKAASNGAEVAGVIAHEIGHITMHHGANKLVQLGGLNLVNQIIFGSDSASIALAVTQAVEGLFFLKLSRDDEEQADSCAVAYTTVADYNPIGMKTFLEILKAKSGPTPFEPLSTHPDTQKRIDEVERIIAKTPNAPMGPTEKLWADEFSAIKNKI